MTTSILENVRKRPRSLVKFVEKAKQPIIYTDFVDVIGEDTVVDLPGFDVGHDIERFRDKIHLFLKAHENDPVIHKLRWNERLHKEDLDTLEQILIEAGAGTKEDVGKVRVDGKMGLFVRSMMGMDREAAKPAFGSLSDKP